MTSRIALTIATVAGLIGAFAVASPARAATTEYACPTSAGWSTSGFDTYKPTEIATNPLTEPVGCAAAWAPPMYTSPTPPNDVSQLIRDVGLYFGPLPATIFVGNDVTVRVVGTPANSGFLISGWVNKETAQNSPTSPDYFVRQRVFSADGVAGHSGTVERTVDYTVTVTDPDKRAKILAGDFVILAGIIGGRGTDEEILRSVSIPFTAFEVSFQSNGGSGTMNDATGAVAANLPANTLTRDGYLFNGWNDDQYGNGNAYTDGELFSFDADTTLYAQWILDPNANSGDGNAERPSGDGASDAAHLPNTGIDSSALGLLSGLLASAGMLVFLVAARRRTR